MKNISKNPNLYPYQSQITLFTLPWGTLYQKYSMYFFPVYIVAPNQLQLNWMTKSNKKLCKRKNKFMLDTCETNCCFWNSKYRKKIWDMNLSTHLTSETTFSNFSIKFLNPNIFSNLNSNCSKPKKHSITENCSKLRSFN